MIMIRGKWRERQKRAASLLCKVSFYVDPSNLRRSFILAVLTHSAYLGNDPWSRVSLGLSKMLPRARKGLLFHIVHRCVVIINVNYQFQTSSTNNLYAISQALGTLIKPTFCPHNDQFWLHQNRKMVPI